MCQLFAKCACCGKEGTYEMNENENSMFIRYQVFGRQLGYIQDLFPDVPAWIRSVGIDLYSGGLCICQDCTAMELNERYSKRKGRGENYIIT